MLSLAVSYCWPIHRLDVTNVFLDGNLNEHVYCEQPSDFVHPARPDHVCFLLKVLCGLKQAPWVWFHGFAAHLRSLGFHESKSDTSLFVYHRDSATTYLLLHVDDIILTASSSKLLRTIIDALGVELICRILVLSTTFSVSQSLDLSLVCFSLRKIMQHK